MPRNIIERAIIPNNPSSNKVIHNNQYYLYAPVGGVNKVGMAGFDGSQFDVSNGQIVSLKSSFVNQIVDLVIERLEEFQRDEPWIGNDMPDGDDYTAWFKPVSGDEPIEARGTSSAEDEPTEELTELDVTSSAEDEPTEELTELDVTPVIEDEPTEELTELDVTIEDEPTEELTELELEVTEENE